MIRLDLKDKKLLMELDLDSRQSIQQIAKKIGLSKDAVKYRIKKLTEEGIIKSFTAVVDTGKLGLISFRMLLRIYNTTPEREKELVEFIANNPAVIWMVQVEGSWDINLCFQARTVKKMYDFHNQLLEKFKNNIEKKEFGIFTHITYFSRPYLLPGKREKKKYYITTLSEEVKIDAEDQKIIKMLAKNSRESIVNIAKTVKLTPKTVMTKIKRLEKEGVINGYRTEFDLEKLGYQYYKVHLETFNTTKEQLNKFKTYVEDHPNIVYKDEVTGGYDFEIEIQVENSEKLRELINEIRKEFSGIIRNYEVLHYYKEYKLRFFPEE